MLASAAAFELRFHLTRPITWFYLVLFVAEGVLSVLFRHMQQWAAASPQAASPEELAA